MKDTNNKTMKKEQKLYTVLLGFGICALAVVTVFYGITTFREGERIEQEIQSGDNNLVSGPVAEYEKEDDDEKKANSEKEEKTPADNGKKKSQAVESTERKGVQEAGYDGVKKLSWPVTGNVIIPYSMDTTVYFETLDQYQCNPALYIKAEKGTEVKAICEGEVTVVKKDARYGTMVTTDLGNGYKVCYGQLSDCKLKKGDKVKAGDIIGKIGEPTDYFKLEGPHLYLKMTLQGKEINPAQYLES